MYPTRRGLLLIATNIPAGLAMGIFSPGLWPLSLALLAASLLAVGIDGLRAIRPADVGIAVACPPVIYIGRQEMARVTVAVPAGAPRLLVELIVDVGRLLAPPAASTLMLAADASNDIGIVLEPLRRGMAEFHRVWLRWAGPWGLTYRQRLHPVNLRMPVLPDIRSVRDVALRFAANEGLPGARPDAGAGEGSAFHALRDYVSGQDPRAIDWKHSARHRSLLVKEFQAERDHQIVLAFDTGHLMSEPMAGMTRLDRAINAGLLLAYLSLRGGDRVGLFGFDSQVRTTLEPVMGIAAFGHLQRAAAALDYSTEETNFTLALTALLARLNRRSLIVIVTEFIDTVTAEMMIDNLGRAARRHLILFVTLRDNEVEALAEAEPYSAEAVARAAIAHDFLRDRQIVFERLRRLGVMCLEAPGRQIGPELLNRYLDIKRRELI